MNVSTKKILIATVVFGVMAFGYGIARTNGCSSVSDTFECEAEWATIQESLERCKESCPTKQAWQEYCEETRFMCEGDCEFLLDQGKSQKDVELCKQRCRDAAKKCKASFATKTQCEQSCQDSYESSKEAFEDRLSNAR
ncbi:hypothetical protein KAH94_03235 [bacterium]|nr:hypothetical protein [bacterium]